VKFPFNNKNSVHILEDKERFSKILLSLSFFVFADTFHVMKQVNQERDKAVKKEPIKIKNKKEKKNIGRSSKK
jgi:hypothetical protein